MGFFANFWTWLNAQLATYIGTKTAVIAAAIVPAAVGLATIYVMIWGYLELTGRIKEPILTGCGSHLHADRRVWRCDPSMALQRDHRGYVL